MQECAARDIWVKFKPNFKFFLLDFLYENYNCNTYLAYRSKHQSKSANRCVIL